MKGYEETSQKPQAGSEVGSRNGIWRAGTTGSSPLWRLSAYPPGFISLSLQTDFCCSGLQCQRWSLHGTCEHTPSVQARSLAFFIRSYFKLVHPRLGVHSLSYESEKRAGVAWDKLGHPSSTPVAMSWAGTRRDAIYKHHSNISGVITRINRKVRFYFRIFLSQCPHLCCLP